MLVHVFSEIVDERNFLFQFRWMISNRTESLSEVFVDILQFVAIFMQDNTCWIVIQNTNRIVAKRVPLEIYYQVVIKYESYYMTHKLTDSTVGIVVVGSRLCKSDRFQYKRSLNGDPKQQKKAETESGKPEFRSLLTKCPPLKKFNSGTLMKNGRRHGRGHLAITVRI